MLKESVKELDDFTLGQRIQEIRVQKQIKAVDMAVALDMSKDQYSRIENGRSGCSTKHLYQIAQYLEVSADYLLFGEVEEGILAQIHRMLANMGEEDQFYIRNHHEPIVSREIWDEAERIRLKRNTSKVMATTGNRERYTRKYSFSSMCECGFCGHKLSRRTRHSSTKYWKIIWHCMNATKNGIDNCPHCKAIDETILESSFVEAFGLLAGNFEDVIETVISNTESVLSSQVDMNKKKQIEREISTLETKKSKMTDMLIDDIIGKEAYEEKSFEITRKIHTLTERKALLDEALNKQKDVGRRMSALREILKTEKVLDVFDRDVFESIIEKVIVGGYDKDGNPDPYKLTFVLQGNQSGVIPDAKKPLQRNAEREGILV